MSYSKRADYRGNETRTPQCAPRSRRPPRGERVFQPPGRSHRRVFRRRGRTAPAARGRPGRGRLAEPRGGGRSPRNYPDSAGELAVIAADTDVLIDFLSAVE